MPRPPKKEATPKTPPTGLPFSSLPKENQSSAVNMVSDPESCGPDDPSPAAPEPLITFILATHNRASVLLHTLERIAACGLAPREYEILIVDNCSTDGTAELIRRHVSGARLIVLERNRGSCAKGLAVP
ncbi:MAG: glycosyltransferase, partial [Planctomycetes bacterium]|nr:glycosyltransferase [Planctomycetota bacterium]